jgi:hypothetical protein
MSLLLIILIVVAVLALGGWGYGYYAARPVAVTDVAAPAAGPSPIVSVIGVIGLLALIAFFVLWATGWNFGFQAVPPP